MTEQRTIVRAGKGSWTHTPGLPCSWQNEDGGAVWLGWRGCRNFSHGTWLGAQSRLCILYCHAQCFFFLSFSNDTCHHRSVLTAFESDT